MKSVLIYLILILLGTNFVVNAEKYKQDSLLSIHQYDNLNTNISPKVIGTKDILFFSLALGSSFILDEKINTHFFQHKTGFMDSYGDVSTYFGEKTIIAPATIVSWAIGKCIKDEKLSNTSLNSAKALFCGALLCESLKYIAGRDRPDELNGNMQFKLLGGNSNQHKSFPSGHSFVAWAAFTPFAEQYSKWIYIIPASVSISRVYRNRHWFSDVFMGAGIGYFAGLYFHNRKNKKIIFNSNGLIIKF